MSGKRVVGRQQDLYFEKLLKLRVAVARFGELDVAGWWNSNGQLSRVGTAVLRRGFPRTHSFAQARSVLAIAAQKCEDLFDFPDSVTLWKLPPELEAQLDARWGRWLEQSRNWDGFFESIREMNKADLVDVLRRLELVSDSDLDAHGQIVHSVDERGVQLPGVFEGGDDASLAALALGFALSQPGTLQIPYLRRAAV